MVRPWPTQVCSPCDRTDDAALADWLKPTVTAPLDIQQATDIVGGSTMFIGSSTSTVTLLYTDATIMDNSVPLLTGSQTEADFDLSGLDVEISTGPEGDFQVHCYPCTRAF